MQYRLSVHAERCKARQGKARQGKARQGKARQGKFIYIAPFNTRQFKVKVKK